MKTLYARIENNKVEEIFETDRNIADVFHPSITWVDINSIVPTPQCDWDAVDNAGVWSFTAPSGPTKKELWSDYQTLAKDTLSKTAVTVERIAEAVSLGLTTWTAVDVVAFMQYRRDLRAILSQVQPTIIPSALPIAPAYPSGT